MALRRSLGVVAIPLAETLITLAASISGLVPGVLEDGVLMPHQQAADQIGGDLLGGAAEEGLGEVLGKRGGYGSGLGGDGDGEAGIQ